MKRGFTLVELLVVISILGILIALSIFGLQGAREAARDGRRRADLELIRSGVEIYKSDCNEYPPDVVPGQDLVGDGSVPSCAVTNIYISSVPKDPLDISRLYRYARGSDGTTYEVCAALEAGEATTVFCGITSNCGEVECNYKVTNP